MYEYRAFVRDVHDGDTVTVDIDLGFDTWIHSRHIRMLGINAPELKDKPAGPDARDYLRGILPVDTVVMIRTHKDQVDKYGGRYDGTIITGHWLNDVLVNQVNVNDLMISSGHAVRYVMP